MTKADRIRQLARHGIFSTREIADKIAEEFGACSVAYARVYARQRLNGDSIHDRNYRRRNRDAVNANHLRWYWENRDRINEKRRVDYANEAAHA